MFATNFKFVSCVQVFVAFGCNCEILLSFSISALLSGPVSQNRFEFLRIALEFIRKQYSFDDPIEMV